MRQDEAKTTATRNLYTVRQFIERHPWATHGGVRHLIFHADKNGFSKCIRRVGRRVLIDEERVFEWLDEQGGCTND
ncbi:MAG: hypothetical protein JXR94_09515 [Candidatus Hydrogenedentes bacterium]|nr:hypothetical protein [Candidatus Hydrogenedentota bacterium]